MEVEQDKVLLPTMVDLAVVVLIQVLVVLHLTQEVVQETHLQQLQLKEQMVVQVIHKHLRTLAQVEVELQMQVILTILLLMVEVEMVEQLQFQLVQ